MKLKVGIDLVKMARITQALARVPSLATRLFSVDELECAAALPPTRRTEFLAGRFAAKEAVIKALHLQLGNGEVMGEIEVLKRADGAPRLVLSGRAATAAKLSGVVGQVSITHEAGLACAVALFAAVQEGPA